jgi:hypothetical protein
MKKSRYGKIHGILQPEPELFVDVQLQTVSKKSEMLFVRGAPPRLHHPLGSPVHLLADSPPGDSVVLISPHAGSF